MTLGTMRVECPVCGHEFETHDGGNEDTRTSCPRCPSEPLKFEHEVRA